MIFCDFEVFKYDWLIVALDMIERKEHVIINNPDELQALYERHVHDIWGGFNIRHYDQYILKAILCEFDPKKINDYIIVKGNPGYKYSSLFRKCPLNIYDVMLGTDRGLKTFEGFMGNDIKESSVPFDIDRKLTDSEIQETVKYCRHDVEQTVQVFLKRVEEFNTMMYFIRHFKLPLSAISKTKSQLAAEILGGNRKGQRFDDEFDFPILECVQLKKYKFVADWYQNPENHDYEKSQKKVIVAGVEHNFSWGGGHGARLKYHGRGIFLIIDVTAYYPAMQKKFKFGYRVMDKPENFEFIHDSNIEFKKKGDKKARLPFKIMDNAISGQMKQKSSALYDPMSNNSICINGQMLLLDLIEHLEPYCDLIQNNTDGIIVKVRDYNRDFDIIDDIVAEWETRTGMEMEFDQFFGEIYQKDVNNYMIIDRETGAMKTKGAYLKPLSDLDYDLPIVNKALNNYMVDAIPVETTINQCDDLKEFQQVKKITTKYKHLIHGGTFSVVNKKKVFNHDGEIVKEKCVRVFASKVMTDGGLFKEHVETGGVAKVENSPEHCFFYNEKVNGVRCPRKLDKQWYVNMAYKRLKDFGVT